MGEGVGRSGKEDPTFNGLTDTPGLPRGRGHGPFAQKGPLKNPRGRDKKRAVRGREGAVKEPQNLKRGRTRFELCHLQIPSSHPPPFLQ